MIDALRYKRRRAAFATDPQSIIAALAAGNSEIYSETRLRSWPAMYLIYG